jgi:hypothetical protein
MSFLHIQRSGKIAQKLKDENHRKYSGSYSYNFVSKILENVLNRKIYLEDFERYLVF